MTVHKKTQTKNLIDGRTYTHALTSTRTHTGLAHSHYAETPIYFTQNHARARTRAHTRLTPAGSHYCIVHAFESSAAPAPVGFALYLSTAALALTALASDAILALALAESRSFSVVASCSCRS